MATPPTMKDVALAANVSVMTVSRAFKAGSTVAAAKRALIRQVADDLGYVFDSTASNLRLQRTGFVAVIIPSLNNANFADTVGALSAGLAADDLHVLLAYSNYDIAVEESLIAQLLRRRPEAIVLTGGQHTPGARRLLERAQIPVIETWDLPAHPIGHVVGFSNEATMEAMVDHLTSLGLSRLGFIGGDAAFDTRGSDRRRGFLAALAARGLPAHRLISGGQPPVKMAHGAVAMADLLQQFPDTEAVVCVSDLAAFGALSECQRRGVRVPQDIRIAGFGAFDIAQVCVPTLTTIDPACAEIGRRTAALIVSILRGDAPPAVPVTEAIIPHLRIGGSTVQPPR